MAGPTKDSTHMLNAISTIPSQPVGGMNAVVSRRYHCPDATPPPYRPQS